MGIQIAAQSSTTDKRLAEMQAKIEECTKKQEETIKKQNLRIQCLEREVTRLGEKADDLDMRSRKYNVRIENIPYVEKESDSQLLEKVITECAKVGIQLKDGDVARCHRSSKPKEMRDGTLKAQTIIKLSNWPARKLFQGAGKTA